MTDQQRRLLKAILAFQEDHQQTNRPVMAGVGRARVEAAGRLLTWDEERHNGPRIASLYSPGGGDAERKRVSRGIAALTIVGLVETWGPCGANVTRVRLTSKGLAEAQALARDTQATSRQG
jgi:hypothetical protein